MDFGAGGGELLIAAEERGFHGVGIEVDGGATSLAESRGFFMKEQISSLQPMGIGVASFSHVLEHLEEPETFIETAVERLIPGGLVVVVQPNPSGLLPRLLPRRWPGWVADQHCWHFTVESMKELLARQGLHTRRIKVSGLHYRLRLGRSFPYHLLGRTAAAIGVGDAFWLAAGREESLR